MSVQSLSPFVYETQPYRECDSVGFSRRTSEHGKKCSSGSHADLSVSQAFRRRLDGVAYSTYILIMILVPLKIWCRKKAGGWRNIRLDDYMSILALLIANGFFYVCIIGRLRVLAGS